MAQSDSDSVDSYAGMDSDGLEVNSCDDSENDYSCDSFLASDGEIKSVPSPDGGVYDEVKDLGRCSPPIAPRRAKQKAVHKIENLDQTLFTNDDSETEWSYESDLDSSD